MRFFYSLVLIFLSIICLSQHYDFSAGIKLDDSFIAATAQKRIGNQSSVELMIPLTKNDISIVVLGKQHFKIIGKRLNFNTGVGLHTGNNFYLGRITGIDAIAGFEYTFFFIPYTIAFDFRPYIDFRRNYSAYHLQSGFSIRYIFDQREPLKDWFQKLKKDKKWKNIEF